jgi:serine/threonine protein kinase
MEEEIQKQAKSDNMDSKYVNKKDSLINTFFYPNFKPVKKLGEGSFGKIYSAVNISNQQNFALKMVKK